MPLPLLAVPLTVSVGELTLSAINIILTTQALSNLTVSFFNGEKGLDPKDILTVVAGSKTHLAETAVVRIAEAISTLDEVNKTFEKWGIGPDFGMLLDKLIVSVYNHYDTPLPSSFQPTEDEKFDMTTPEWKEAQRQWEESDQKIQALVADQELVLKAANKLVADVKAEKKAADAKAQKEKEAERERAQAERQRAGYERQRAEHERSIALRAALDASMMNGLHNSQTGVVIQPVHFPTVIPYKLPPVQGCPGCGATFGAKNTSCNLCQRQD
jgi:hypothetical protein